MSPSARRAKRLLDIVASVAGLTLVGPFVPLLALALRWESRGPLFVQEACVGVQRRARLAPERGGRRLHDAGGRLFMRRRFRVLGPQGRPTRVGRWLRRTGLEGWPQLLTVLTGQMSIVGSRPVRVDRGRRLSAVWPTYRNTLSHNKPGICSLSRHARGVSFAAEVCEKLFFDLSYRRLLADSGFWATLGVDLKLIAAAMAVKFGRRRTVGNDALAVEAPSAFRQLRLDPRVLTARVPDGVNGECTEEGNSSTLWWYPPRRDDRLLPEPADLQLSELCDEFHASSAAGLVFVLYLQPLETPAVDSLHVDIPVGLNDVERLAEHLMPLWADLAPRATREHFADAATCLLMESLCLVAAGVGDLSRRLELTLQVGRSELRLCVEPGLRSAPAPESLTARLVRLVQPTMAQGEVHATR